MNPLELIDLYETQEITKLQQRATHISPYDAEQIIVNFASLLRKSIYNGEFIFNIETMQNKVVQVSDKSFNMKRILSNNDKEILIVQLEKNQDEKICESDLDILSQQMEIAVKKSKNIDGVLLLDPDMEISLLTAKVSSNDYASKNLEFSDEDLKTLQDFKSKQTGEVVTSTFTYPTGAENLFRID